MLKYSLKKSYVDTKLRLLERNLISSEDKDKILLPKLIQIFSALQFTPSPRHILTTHSEYKTVQLGNHYREAEVSRQLYLATFRSTLLFTHVNAP